MITSVCTPAILVPRRAVSVLVEPPPPGYNPNAASFEDLGKALMMGAGPVAALLLGGYAGIATGAGAALAGALALGTAGAAAGYMAGKRLDARAGLGGPPGNRQAAGLAAGVMLGSLTGALAGATLSSPWVAGGMAIAGALGATCWTMVALDR